MPRLATNLTLLPFCIFLLGWMLPAQAQSFDGVLVSIPGGTFTMGEPETSYEGPPGSYDALEHTVTVSAFHMSETEVSHAQFVAFLNAALQEGLLEVKEETSFMPDLGKMLIYGTTAAPAEYAGQALYDLEGTRVMKDHDNADGDGDSFTGVIEPENPLNIAYIGYDESRPAGEQFYLKDPRNASDFDWNALTDYYNYTSVSRQEDTSVLLNDFAAWPQLADYPNNLPTVEEVANWPATFVRWYGAKAFALYYGLDLPTEAEWEYAARGGSSFVYATDDGNVDGDGTSANWNHLLANPSLNHVEDVKRGAPNPFGLYNMAGNVWEWVEDWYASDFYAEGVVDPVNTTDTGLKVRRGGSWNYHQSTLKTAARARDEQFKGNDHFGFRVVSRAGDTSQAGTDDVPKTTWLAPNYPNPFNPTTEIQYHLAQAGPVQLTVYNVLGQAVAHLVDRMEAAGSYRVQFEAAHLPSGVYLYRLATQGQVQTRQMLLVK